MSSTDGGAAATISASGTIANLEALWVARELRPDGAVVSAANAHYTHARACEIIGDRRTISSLGSGMTRWPTDLSTEFHSGRSPAVFGGLYPGRAGGDCSVR